MRTTRGKGPDQSRDQLNLFESEQGPKQEVKPETAAPPPGNTAPAEIKSMFSGRTRNPGWKNRGSEPAEPH